MPDESSYQDDERRWSAWMAAANKGDKAVYQQLLTELGDVVEAYVRLRFGNFQLLEDCVQECLMALHSARHTYDHARPFRPWMFTIIRHKTIDILRKSRRDSDLATSLQQQISADVEGSGRERLHRLIDGIKILENIAPDHRDAVALTHYGGYTVPEAALQLGISESALKARLRRGLQAIRKQLEAEELPQ